MYRFLYSSKSIIVQFSILVNVKIRISVFLAHLHKRRGIELGTLYERIISLCQEKGITGGKLCTDLQMSKGTLTDLKMGRQTGLSATKAQKIASYFDVSVGYLLGEEEKRQSTESELSIIKKEFIKKIENMTDAQVEKLEQILALVERTDV